MTEMLKVQVCYTFAVYVIWNEFSKCKYFDFFFFFSPQHYGTTNRLSTQLTLMHWSEPLPLERGFPNVGLQVRWRRDIQDKGPWWVEVQLYSRSPSVVVPVSRQVWEDLWLHSSKGSQVGNQLSWVIISLCKDVNCPGLLFCISPCIYVIVRIFVLLIDISLFLESLIKTFFHPLILRVVVR